MNDSDNPPILGKPAAPGTKFESAKSGAKPAPKPTTPDGIPVRALYLRESLDVGRGDGAEQQISTITTGKRDGKPQYRITWLPRDRMYHLRVWKNEADVEKDAPLRTFLLDPTDVLAELEVP